MLTTVQRGLGNGEHKLEEGEGGEGEEEEEEEEILPRQARRSWLAGELNMMMGLQCPLCQQSSLP